MCASRTAYHATGIAFISCMTMQSLQIRYATAQDLGDRIEEIRPTEPVGVSQLSLMSVVLRQNTPVRANWQPVLSILVPQGKERLPLNVEVRDSRDFGYFMKPADPCSREGKCEFRWPDDTLKRLGLRQADLWPLARVSSNPVDKKFLPVCLCSISELQVADAVIDFVLVPSRPVHFVYRLKDEGGNQIQTGTFRNVSAGHPTTITFKPKRGQVTRSVKLELSYVTASEGETERFSDSFTVLWRQ